MATQVATPITMPKRGESVTEGTIGAWLKQVGDLVEKYEPLVEVVTDKVNAEIPAPVSGVLVEILVEPETTVPVAPPLSLIDESGSADVAPAAASAAGAPDGDAGRATAPAIATSTFAARTTSSADRRSGGIADEVEMLRTRSSPAVRRIAEEHGI